MQELGANSVVETNAARDFLNISTHLLAKVGYFVDKSYLGRQERVGRVFYQFCGTPGGVKNWRLIKTKRPIDLCYNLLGVLIFGSDNDAIGMLEIVDRRALAQKLRIGDHHKVGIRSRLSDNALYLVTGAHRYRRLGNNDGESVERGGDFPGRVVDVGKVRMAVTATRRRANRDKDRFRGADGFVERGAERQPSCLDI